MFSANTQQQKSTNRIVLCYWDLPGRVNEGRTDLDSLDFLGVGPEGGGRSVYLDST